MDRTSDFTKEKSDITSSITNVEGREKRNISGYRSILDYNQMALSGVRRHNPPGGSPSINWKNLRSF